MRVRIRKRAIVVAAAVLLTTMSVVIWASDHVDFPDALGANLDISDIYAFTDGDDIVFVMNVRPLLTPGEATNNVALNPVGLYQFKLTTDRAAGVEDAVIQVTVDQAGPDQQ